MSERPRLSKPPLTEVVCGVKFEPLPLALEHIAELRQALKEDYPKLSLQPAVMEPGDEFEFVFGVAGPALKGQRCLLEREGSPWIVQVQQDRFFFNWRGEGEHYPGFEGVGGVLEGFLAVWRRFVELMGEVTVTRAEVVKVNMLQEHVHWHGVEDLTTLLPFLGGLRLALADDELHFNVVVNNVGPLQRVISARTERLAKAEGLRVRLELSARRQCDEQSAALGEVLKETNAAMNEHFFKLFSATAQERFGGLI